MLTSCPGRLAPLSEFSRCPPVVPDYSQSGPRARGVTSWPGRFGSGSECPMGRSASRATRARVRGPAGSTSCPGRLVQASKGPRFRPEVPGDSGPGPSAGRIHLLSRVPPARVRSPTASTRFPRQIRPVSKAHGIDQMSLANGPVSEVLWRRAAVLGEFGPSWGVRGVNQLSQANWARFRGPTVSTSCPGQLRLRFRSLQG